MRSMHRLLVVAGTTLALLLAVACDDEALNEFGAEGAHQMMISIELHDGWIGSPEAMAGGEDGEPTQLHIHPHSDLTLMVVNVGEGPHSFALYADQAGTELLVRSTALAPGTEEEVRYHFHDPQIAYFFDDAHRDTMRGELHVSE